MGSRRAFVVRPIAWLALATCCATTSRIRAWRKARQPAATELKVSVAVGPAFALGKAARTWANAIDEGSRGHADRSPVSRRDARAARSVARIRRTARRCRRSCRRFDALLVDAGERARGRRTSVDRRGTRELVALDTRRGGERFPQPFCRRRRNSARAGAARTSRDRDDDAQRAHARRRRRPCDPHHVDAVPRRAVRRPARPAYTPCLSRRRTLRSARGRSTRRKARWRRSLPHASMRSASRTSRCGARSARWPSSR